MAQQYTAKGYCATKSRHYYGVKLHVIARRRTAGLPVPEFMGITPASEHDLTALRPVLDGLERRCIVLDKAYADRGLKLRLQEEKQTMLLTPVKKIAHTPENLICLDQAHDDLFSTAVSSIRQPIESLFNWLQ